ncbi:Crp/Fnr family transcriptional regulator [Paenibacillus sp. CGMCC 1.16610]|uniref:Helix-turn-helix domain-containing protein n=1 Tax=Paenibacillus anseongense TaxID=2682845 RepID=A0ABW9UJ37_9BACL|nr:MULTISPECIES: Crp/Fnr family transcriptional regulator [Paenibacillus]MBA2939631.1 Crp/Fnr family transcriptional regulator [Paenibacillus sp. CGMCC 1.16610]MVQ39292.1 helix-turn-helix domain-containing protein [Paenibacillus anseongense]
MMDKLWYLSKIHIFEALPPEDLMEIDQMTPMTHFSAIPKGTIVQTPDSNRDGLFFIKTGKLRVYKINLEGKQYTAAILGAGNMFGEIDAFSLGTRDGYIETLEETLLCSVHKDQFEQFLLQRPELVLRFLKEVSKKLNEASELLERLALGTVHERVLYLLLRLSSQFGIPEEHFVKIDLPLTHMELAHMIGATRESVTNSLNELSKQGIIRSGRKKILVDQKKAKESLALDNN